MFDFGPAEASDGLSGEPTVQEMQRRDQRMSVWTWVLVGVNAVVLLMVVIIFYLMSRTDNSSTPGTTDGASSGTVTGSSDGSTTGSTPTTGGSNSSAGSGSSSLNGGTGGSQGSGSSDGSAATDPTSRWDQNWTSAIKLEQSHDLEGALLMLNKLKNAPDSGRSKKLAVAIDRIQEKRRREPGESKIFN